MDETPSPPQIRVKVLVLLAAVGASGVFFIDLCDAVFGCGCRSLWNGAAEACNIHLADGRHCPWCLYPRGGAIAFSSVLFAQATAIFWPTRLGIWARLAIAMAALPLVGGAVALLQGLLWGYWR